MHTWYLNIEKSTAIDEHNISSHTVNFLFITWGTYDDKTYLQTMLRFLDALLVTMSAELFRRYRTSHVYSSMSLQTNFDSVIYIDV